MTQAPENQQEQAACERPEKKPPLGQVKTVGIHDLTNGGEQACGIIYADLHAEQFVFNATSEEWMRWQGHHWERDTTGQARSAVEYVALWLLSQILPLAGDIMEAFDANDKEKAQYLQRVQREVYKRVKWLRSEHGRSSTLSFAAFNAYRPLAVTAEAFDTNPLLLACSNCIIDLKTGEGQPGQQKDYISLASPIDYLGLDKPASACSAWERFVDEITLGNSELKEYLQRLAGYIITGFVKEHVLPVFFGLGRNGKSTYIELIKFIIGPLATALAPEILLDQGRVRNSAGPSPDIMQTKGRRLGITPETDAGNKISPSATKRLTGGDSLTGRNPHDKYPTTFNPTCKIVLLCNDKPRAPADDYAFWRRVHLIPFDATFVEYDPQQPSEFRIDKELPEKLKAEASGILAWMVRGCLEWQQRGLDPPAAVRDATAQYQASEDMLGEWLAANCVVHEKAGATAKDLYNDFSTWWRENISATPMSQKKFGTLLGRRFERVEGRPVGYLGVGLFPNWDDRDDPAGKASSREPGAADYVPF